MDRPQRAASMEGVSSSSASSAPSAAASCPCPCLPAARAWLSSSANSLRLRLHDATNDEWRIEVPSLGTADSGDGEGRVCFSISLPPPHGLSVDEQGSVLDELEADSYSVLFGDGEQAEKERARFTKAAEATNAAAATAAASSHPAAAAAPHDGCTVSAILAYAHSFIRRLENGWASPSRASHSAAAAATDDAEESGSQSFDMDDSDTGFGAGGDGDEEDGWGDAHEMDASDMGVDSYAEEAAATSSPSKHSRMLAESAAASSSSAAAAASPAAAAFSPTVTAHASGSVKVLSQSEVSDMQSALISRVATALDITLSAAIVLLRAVRWNEEACMARFRAEGPKFASEVGCQGLLREYVLPAPASSELFCCSVCYDDEVPWERTYAMRCGHRFCLGCWGSFLASEIEGGSVSGGSALGTRCAGPKCAEVLGKECVELILASSDSEEQEAQHARLLQRYEHLLFLSFVDENDSLQWCPAAGCERVLHSGSAKVLTVRCSCGCLFCFRCKLDAHAPCSCREAEEWMARDKGSANMDTKYLMEQTKACPTCHVRTKKEGGCMYVTCSQCKCAWCWHCGQDGKDHHVWECNRPQYDDGDKSSELNRYLFYFERYFNHKESMKMAMDNIARVEDKMGELVAEGMHFKQVEFVKSAALLVIQCRRVLSWSYARAFFLPQSDKAARTLFEWRQSELEQYTEKLNQLTEGSIEQLTKDRLLVLDWTRALDKYLKNMESDESHSERAIPAHAMALTTRIGKTPAEAAAAQAAGAKANSPHGKAHTAGGKAQPQTLSSGGGDKPPAGPAPVAPAP